MVALVLGLLLAASPDSVPTPDVVVVCPRDWQSALQPWAEHRQRQGHVVRVVTPAETAEATRRAIALYAATGHLRAVLLVGDVPPWSPVATSEAGGTALPSGRVAQGAGASAADLQGRAPAVDGAMPAARGLTVPAFYLPAKVNVRYGSPPAIASDFPYADLDDDGRAELAVGRWSVESISQLRAVIAKTLAYERSGDFGPRRRRVVCLAGVGSFGPLVDPILEATARGVLCDLLPPQYEIAMTYANWRSPYCPDPRRLSEITRATLAGGALFWVYIGHGQPYGLDRVRLGADEYALFEPGDAAALRGPGGAVALMLSCYCGAFDASRPCLAEELLRAPGGPAAVLAGSRVTMPYAMSVFGGALIQQLSGEPPETLGELVRRAKNATLAAADEKDAFRRPIEAVAAALSPNRQSLDAERQEHLWMFNLLGDPLLRIAYPKAIPLTLCGVNTQSVGEAMARNAAREDASGTPAVLSEVAAGGEVVVRGTSPVPGEALFELTAARGCLRFDPPVRSFPIAAADFAAMQATYEEAQNARWLAVQRPLDSGPFAVRLPIPCHARGECEIRVFIGGTSGSAAGAAQLRVVAVSSDVPQLAVPRTRRPQTATSGGSK